MGSYYAFFFYILQLSVVLFAHGKLQRELYSLLFSI